MTTDTRSKIVFVLLVAMMGGFVAMGITRVRSPHTMPATQASDADTPDAGADGSAPEGTVPVSVLGSDAAAATPPPVASAPAVVHDSGIKPVMDRPLRVVGVGWELLAAGIVANGGRTAGEGSVFAARGLTVQLRTAESPIDVERQLARGGADTDGADVALVPLPALVGAYEHLRVLEPQAFFLVGWSRGREALFGASDASLLKARAGDVKLFAPVGGAPLGLGLFALDTAGMAASRVRMVQEEKDAQYAAVARPFSEVTVGAGPGKLLLTTAEASRLVPLVMVAPRALIASHAAALTVLARGWLDGVATLGKDVPAAARLVAHEDGAPEPATLLDRLGQIDWASPADDVRAFGIAGRSSAPLPVLFTRFWRLWRDAGLVTSPAPENTSVPNTIVAALVQADPRMLEEAKEPKGEARATPPTAGAKVLLVLRRSEAKIDEAAFVADATLLAGVFDHSVLRISSRSGAIARTVVDKVVEGSDVPASRLVIGTTPPDGASAAVEVLAAP